MGSYESFRVYYPGNQKFACQSLNVEWEEGKGGHGNILLIG